MLTYIEIDPIAFHVMDIAVHWYGLMFLIAIVQAWLVGAYRARLDWRPVRPRQVEDLVFYAALGAIAGGRIGFIWFYPQHEIMQEPFWIFKVWEGGMSFHGGLLGVMLAMMFYSQKIKQPYFRVLDFIAPLIPLGLLAGNLGNFIGQELWGTPSDGPLAMVFPADPEGLPRHPSQLYQAFLEGLLLFVVLAVYARKPRPTGAVCAIFAILYGCFRIAAELYREPDAHIQYDLVGWVTRGQLLSIPMVILGCLLLLATYVFSMKQHSKKQQRVQLLQVDGQDSGGEKPLADKEPSADNEPSADKESSTDREPSAGKGSSTDRESSADNELSADNEPSADRESSLDNELSADNEPSADRESSTDNEPSADNGPLAGKGSPTDKKPSADRGSPADRESSTGKGSPVDKGPLAGPQLESLDEQSLTASAESLVDIGPVAVREPSATNKEPSATNKELSVGQESSVNEELSADKADASIGSGESSTDRKPSTNRKPSTESKAAISKSEP